MFCYNKKEKKNMSKETKQEQLWQEVNELIEKAEKGYDAKIVSIADTTSNVFYKNNKYEDREGKEITFKENESGFEWSEFFNIPKELGVLESKLYAFKKEYGELPKIGMKVKAKWVNGNYKVIIAK